MIPICDDQESSGARVPRLRGGHAAAPCTGLALVAIIYPLIQGQTDGWPAWASRSSRPAAILLYVFVRYERRHSHNVLIEPC